MVGGLYLEPYPEVKVNIKRCNFCLINGYCHCAIIKNIKLEETMWQWHLIENLLSILELLCSLIVLYKVNIESCRWSWRSVESRGVLPVGEDRQMSQDETVNFYW